jgi:2',3'-cyclic-nucleotide 2'-phosphodiesterase (5'-nucleotidase family)
MSGEESEQDLFHTHLSKLADIPHTYTLIDTPEKHDELVKKLTIAEAFAFDTETTSTDPIVAELILKYNEEVGWVDDPLGTVSSYLSSSAIKRLVAELYYRKGEELWGDEYDIVLGGGLINTRSPYNIQAGPVTYIQLLPILPFDNVLSLAKISGYDLKRIYQGTSYTYYLSPEHQDLFNTIENDKYYYVVTDRYSSAYSPNNMTEIAILN